MKDREVVYDPTLSEQALSLLVSLVAVAQVQNATARYVVRDLVISQSFAGSGSTSATIVCFVTCPNDVALEMQYAIDQAVGDLLAEPGSKPVRMQ